LAEPKYHGKPISYWIYEVAKPGKKMELAGKAIKEAGADAIPSLIKALAEGKRPRQPACIPELRSAEYSKRVGCVFGR
jgi:hypothetical protein